MGLANLIQMFKTLICYMLANAVEISHISQVVSLEHGRGGLFLFDFKAAFPSLSHGYMSSVLKALGIPVHILNFIQMLYDNHCCHIAMGSQSFRGFGIKAGIRQGCPLSPLIFALVADIILGRMQRLLPDLTIRAFADDIAVVAPDIHTCIPVLVNIFKDTARVSGLTLNIPKCVFIPLWPTDMSILRQDMAVLFPAWAEKRT